MDLKQLEKKARNNIKGSATESIRKGHKKRLSPLRICIWLIEALVLLMIVELVVQKTGENKAVQNEIVQSYAALNKMNWPRAELLRDNALELKALKETADILLPPVDKLAEGSKAARGAQITSSAENHLPVEVVNTIGMHFRLIPEGVFMMGSPPDEWGHWEGEKLHLVQIRKPFYISTTEVTQDQWEAVMGKGSNPARFKGGDRPVEEVNWYNCQRFLIALAKKEDLKKWTYRLPTEEQWEYAARGGTQTPFYFGSDPDDLPLYEWYSTNSYGSTHRTAMLRPNAYGLYDMLGNVWEWCRNTYKPYPGSTEKLSDKYNWDKIRVIRGGNWKVGAELCRVANRARLGPTSKGNMFGFRVVRHLSELNLNENGE
ncbi:MAG: formylglycine-generating enzyme family protein [Lentisphaeria bacterium]